MKYNPESNCCEHGIQWTTPSMCYLCLREEADQHAADYQAVGKNWADAIEEREALSRDYICLSERADRLARELEEARAERDGWFLTAKETNERLAVAQAEVARLEGLILDWREHSISRHLPGLADEARRIRAQREGCRVCATKAVGLPTPGYTHDESCAQREKGE